MHANIGQQYVPANAECIEFLLMMLILSMLFWLEPYCILHVNIQRVLNIQTVGYTQATASIEIKMSQVDTLLHTMFCTCAINTTMNNTQNPKLQHDISMVFH